MQYVHTLLIVVLSIAFQFSPAVVAQVPPADLVLTGGKIVTMDKGRPIVEAIAIEGDRIVAVGSEATIKNYVGDKTKVIALDGKFTMPGFIEGHGHFVGLGESLMNLNLMHARNWDEIVEQVKQAAKVTPPGQWIVGRGWHQSKWDKAPSPNVDGCPTAEAIDKVTPNHPVMLTHASGHMNFANSYAMRLGKVDENTKDPDGGEILRDSNGNPTGVFRETAEELIVRAWQADESKTSPELQAKNLARAVELASQECLKKGITSFQDAGSPMETVSLLRSFARSGRLGVRLWVMIRDDPAAMKGRLANYKMIGYGNNFLTCRALKRSFDGALGSHGAWLLAPYEDMPASAGLNTETVEYVKKTAQLALENDFQLCVHAIGDRANRELLDIYEEIFSQNPSPISRRWRIEHAQHLHPDDIIRFGELGVIASMQAVHCTSDAVFVPKRLGMRRSKEGAYVWRSLMNAGAVITNGTDAPVEDVDPLPSVYASVTRKLSNEVSFFPEQCMTREEALRSYTIDCAYSAFEENLKGSLVPGKLADIVVLSNDLLKCKDEEIKTTKVEMTIVGGEIRYQAGE